MKDIIRDPKFLQTIKTSEEIKQSILQEAQDLIAKPLEHQSL